MLTKKTENAGPTAPKVTESSMEHIVKDTGPLTQKMMWNPYMGDTIAKAADLGEAMPLSREAERPTG